MHTAVHPKDRRGHGRVRILCVGILQLPDSGDNVYGGAKCREARASVVRQKFSLQRDLERLTLIWRKQRALAERGEG